MLGAEGRGRPDDIDGDVDDVDAEGVRATEGRPARCAARILAPLAIVVAAVIPMIAPVSRLNEAERGFHASGAPSVIQRTSRRVLLLTEPWGGIATKAETAANGCA